MLNAAQLLGRGGGIFLGSRTEIFLCGAGVWNLKNVFISALCVHKITSPLMECFSTYNDVLCGFMCWSSQDGATVIRDGSLCKGHPLPLLHSLTKRHHYSFCRFCLWQKPSKLPCYGWDGFQQMKYDWSFIFNKHRSCPLTKALT